jgi:hypothetical protein
VRNRAEDYQRLVEVVAGRRAGYRLCRSSQAALPGSDSFRRQIIEQPPQQKLLQALHYGAAQTFAPYGTFGPALQPGTSKGNLLHELMTQNTDTKVPTARQIAGERYGEQKARQEAIGRRRQPHRSIGYLGQRYLPH